MNRKLLATDRSVCSYNISNVKLYSLRIRYVYCTHINAIIVRYDIVNNGSAYRKQYY